MQTQIKPTIETPLNIDNDQTIAEYEKLVACYKEIGKRLLDYRNKTEDSYASTMGINTSGWQRDYARGELSFAIMDMKEALGY